jgi:hypothetical protein
MLEHVQIPRDLVLMVIAAVVYDTIDSIWHCYVCGGVGSLSDNVIHTDDCVIGRLKEYV